MNKISRACDKLCVKGIPNYPYILTLIKLSHISYSYMDNVQLSEPDTTSVRPLAKGIACNSALAAKWMEINCLMIKIII